MLTGTRTAVDEAHLTVPQVEMLEERPYAAIRVQGKMVDLPEFAPPKFADLYGWLEKRGITGGAGFFRYLGFTADGGVDLEVGALLDAPVAGDGIVTSGTLPAGRHIGATYTGHYDRLFDAFCMMSGWLRGHGLEADESITEDGRSPAAQIEIYRVTPNDTPEPASWKTEILLKLRD
ncbi:MAG: GyrI-like domain-containing protein [Notoacmeibacter sp.]|nr:GyrI-like domain-containing protein [Notoacmeibacter sp.]MCC0032437.1 GyrI-like domain-containing protein [Brucellaceae bacterium]